MARLTAIDRAREADMVRFTLKFLPIVFAIAGIILLGISSWLTV